MLKFRFEEGEVTVRAMEVTSGSHPDHGETGGTMPVKDAQDLLAGTADVCWRWCWNAMGKMEISVMDF